MMNLVLAREAILAASHDVQTHPWGYEAAGTRFPLSAGVTGIVAPEALPADFALGRYTWRDGALVRLPDLPPPPPAVPHTITPLQARRALRAAGLLTAVSAWIGTQPDDVQEAWEYCVEVRRDNALIAGAQAALGLTDTQIDALFRSAAEIVA